MREHSLYCTTCASSLILVASTPTCVKVCRTGLTTAQVSWKSNPKFGYIYEVFSRVAARGNNVSVSNTSNTSLTLNRLTLGETYNIFVVAFLQKGTVLPSAPSKISMIAISKSLH